MKSKHRIIGNSSVKKIEYAQKDSFYYAVPFNQDSDELTVCVSTQVGCPMKCGFCATGDKLFVKNLETDQIREQILDSVFSMQEQLKKKKIRRTKVIAEGMGEASFNINNVVLGFQSARGVLFDEYEMQQVDFGVSTIGNVRMISSYSELALNDPEARTNYDFQISLHSADDSKRKEIIPNMPKVQGNDLTLVEIVDEFSGLARDLGQPMKFNYLLLNSGNGWNNYFKSDLDALVGLSRHVMNDGLDVVVKLTRYSDTEKGFYSPDNSVYSHFIEKLTEAGVKANYVPLVGADIRGACGQLHYKN